MRCGGCAGDNDRGPRIGTPLRGTPGRCPGQALLPREKEETARAACFLSLGATVITHVSRKAKIESEQGKFRRSIFLSNPRHPARVMRMHAGHDAAHFAVRCRRGIWQLARDYRSPDPVSAARHKNAAPRTG